MKPDISVIIPARDEAEFLPRTLEHLRRQSYRRFETIVVANGCVDGTARIARRHARVVRLQEPGVSQARNLGAEMARGQLLLYLDADVLLAPDALQLISERFESRHAVGAFEARPSSDRSWHRALFALRNLSHSSGFYRSVIGSLVCRRELFLKVGGYNQQMMPCENRDLVRRLLRHGDYCYLRSPVEVSMRRWERWGGRRLAAFWLAAYLQSIARRGSRYRPVR